MKTYQCLKSIVISLLLRATLSNGAEALLKLGATLPNEIYLYSVVRVDIFLENTGSGAVTVAEFPIPHLLQVEARNAKTGTIEFEGRVLNTSVSRYERYIPPFVIGPGKKKAFEVLLACVSSEDGTNRQPMFKGRGEFTLRFSYPITVMAAGAKNVQVSEDRLESLQCCGCEERR